MDGTWYSDQELMEARQLLDALAEARRNRDEAQTRATLRTIQDEMGWLNGVPEEKLPPPFLGIKTVLRGDEPKREDGKAERKGAK